MHTRSARPLPPETCLNDWRVKTVQNRLPQWVRSRRFPNLLIVFVSCERYYEVCCEQQQWISSPGSSDGLCLVQNVRVCIFKLLRSMCVWLKSWKGMITRGLFKSVDQFDGLSRINMVCLLRVRERSRECLCHPFRLWQYHGFPVLQRLLRNVT